nr:amino acid aminotransferase [Crateriforma conspicua]
MALTHGSLIADTSFFHVDDSAETVHVRRFPSIFYSGIRTAMSEPAAAPLQLSSVQPAPPDAILGLTESFLADPRSDKMNLTVGVYKDDSGITPIMRAVKQAEQILIEGEKTKGYLPIDGMADYRNAVRDMVFDGKVPNERAAVVQAPGGTGALRVSAEFLADQFARPRVFLPTPTWANHGAIMNAAGLEAVSYRYLSADKTSLDLPGMLDDLSANARPGDVILLHACCHNPSGVDPDAQQWEQIAARITELKLFPLIDFAYQGFGDGLAEDSVGLHTMLRHVPECLVCSSFSKNFGLYSERTGAVVMMAADQAAASASVSQIKRLVRCNYSNPPRHGASIVATILGDEALRRTWKSELMEMRQRIHRLRESFVKGMQEVAPDRDYSFLLSQKGMFSFSGLSPMQVDQLRSEHGIYLVGSGRINVAGMAEDRIDWLCEKVAAVL